jgi:subtilisin family serine protease
LLGAAGSEPAYAAGEEYKPGQVIVKLLPGTSIGDIHDRYGSSTLDDYFGSIGIYLIEPPNSKDAKTFAANLTSESPTNGVLYAEPNFIAETPEAAVVGDGRMRARVYNTSETDPESSHRIAIKNLNLSCEERTNSLGRGVTVAVLDTGAQLNHLALKSNFAGVEFWDFVGKDPNPSEGLDTDRDGIRDRMAGHGTHVAGIVDRVAPQAKIMPLRVLNSKGYGDAYTIAKAVSFAQRHEADVINLSLGSSNPSRLLSEMIDAAIDRGVVVAAAAGNTDTSDPHYPAAGGGLVPGDWTPATADGLIAVASVTSVADLEKQRKSDFSNHGLWVDLAAPGEVIRSAFLLNKYADWSGTSMATAFISGQAALLHAVDGSLEPAGIDGIEDRIRKNVDQLAPQDPGESPKPVGTGHANVCKSLEGLGE